jgi:predicted metal-binding protein
VTYAFDPLRDLVFSEKVVEACHSCKRFGKKASCPPYIAGIEFYRKLLPTYKKGILFLSEFEAILGKEMIMGRVSSIEMARDVFYLRNELFNEGHYLVAPFGAGSCKFCKECSFPCRSPESRLVPLEATGVDVVALVKKLVGFTLEFPVKLKFHRVGAIFYD